MCLWYKRLQRMGQLSTKPADGRTSDVFHCSLHIVRHLLCLSYLPAAVVFCFGDVSLLGWNLRSQVIANVIAVMRLAVTGKRAPGRHAVEELVVSQRVDGFHQPDLQHLTPAQVPPSQPPLAV